MDGILTPSREVSSEPAVLQAPAVLLSSAIGHTQQSPASCLPNHHPIPFQPTARLHGLAACGRSDACPFQVWPTNHPCQLLSPHLCQPSAEPMGGPKWKNHKLKGSGPKSTWRRAVWSFLPGFSWMNDLEPARLGTCHPLDSQAVFLMCT